MGYDMKLMKCISALEPRKLGAAVLAACFLVLVALLPVMQPSAFRLPALNSPLVHAASSNLKVEKAEDLLHLNAPLQKDRRDSDQPGQSNDTKQNKPVCDFSDKRSDICEMDGDIRIKGNNSVFFFAPANATTSQMIGSSWRIKPHPRKMDDVLMRRITEVSVHSSTDRSQLPRCSVNHSVPAVVFSTGGYMGNVFHDFTDVIIPLFTTSREYNGEVQFLVSQIRPLWIRMYKPILKQLSRHKIIDVDADSRVHCYTHAIVGLRSHKEMTITPSRAPNAYSMVDFSELLRTGFNLERDNVVVLGGNQEKRPPPRLLIIARKRTRRFENVEELAAMARKLKYEVVVAEAGPGFARVVNSCDVMVGVHGAGLTNMVFLPAGAVVIQVVPLGGLEGIARGDFGGPSMDLKLRYLEYSISVEESTLMELYPREDPVLIDPGSVHKQGWAALRDAYLVKQNVRIDVVRFKGVLLQALELLKA